MNFDQLKSAWEAGVADPADAATVDRLTRGVHDAERRYRRQALARRIYGSTAMSLALAALIAVPWLLQGVWPGMRVAIALWSASLLACMGGLWWVRSTRGPRHDAPLRERLHASLRAIQREMAYFHALRWLFWLPFGVGFVFAVAWRAPHGGAPLFLLLCTAGLWVWGMLYGPRSMLKRIEPQALAIESILAEADAKDTASSRHA